jgi:hypothetical protein
MYPPAATGRRLPMGYRLGDYVVDHPKTDVIISSFVVHHDPDVLLISSFYAFNINY